MLSPVSLSVFAYRRRLYRDQALHSRVPTFSAFTCEGVDLFIVFDPTQCVQQGMHSTPLLFWVMLV